MCHRWKRRYHSQRQSLTASALLDTNIAFLSLFLLCYCLSQTWAAPAKVKTKKGLPFDDTSISYLTQFGYLPESNRETGFLRTDKQLILALKNLQRFASIPQTGELDNETRRLMSKPRCGVADIDSSDSNRKRRYTVEGKKWRSTNITWSLRTKYFTNGLIRRRVRDDLSKALDLWARHSRLQFEETNSDDADILVTFEKGDHSDGYPFDGLGQILAHAFFPGTGRGGDAHFDIEEIWQLIGEQEKEDGTSLFAVAAHEFGHSLGLSHSSVPDALMYPWYQGIKEDYVLPDDDKYGIQQIYGPKDRGRLWGKNFGDKPVSRYPTIITNESPIYPTRTTTRATTTTTSSTTTTTPRVPITRRPFRPPIDSYEPDKCNTTYDAIAVIRRELFVFKGKYVWRKDVHGRVYAGYPALISRQWSNLPANFTHVDAVYERHDQKIVFFIGKFVYVYQAHTLTPGYPKPLTDLGLPNTLEKIDAAMIWGHNSKTYLFSGYVYWRLEDEGHVELDYPRDMSVWKGVGYNIDTVFQWRDGATYFFKGKGYWKFNDLRMRVFHDKPMQSSKFLFDCAEDNDQTGNSVPTERTNSAEEPNCANHVSNTNLILFTIIIYSAFMNVSFL